MTDSSVSALPESVAGGDMVVATYVHRAPAASTATSAGTRTAPPQALPIRHAIERPHAGSLSLLIA